MVTGRRLFLVSHTLGVGVSGVVRGKYEDLVLHITIVLCCIKAAS